MTLKGLRILVVEDLVDVVSLLHLVLEYEGAEVASATSMGEAIQVLAHFKPDVLVSDIMMPDGDGFSLLSHLRQYEQQQGWQRTPAMAVTAYNREVGRDLALAGGFDAYFAKPADIDCLVATVAQLGQRSRSVCGDRRQENPRIAES